MVSRVTQMCYLIVVSIPDVCLLYFSNYKILSRVLFIYVEPYFISPVKQQQNLKQSEQPGPIPWNQTLVVRRDYDAGVTESMPTQ